MTLHPNASQPGGRALRWRALMLLAAGVLLVHAGLLLQAPAPGAGPLPWAAPAMQFRQIVQVRAPAARAVGAPAPQALPADRPNATRAAALRADPSLPLPGQPAAPTQPSAAQASPSPVVSAEAASADAGGDTLVYATRIPQPVTLRYALQRGNRQGHAELQWQVDEDRYSLTLRNDAGAGPTLGSASQGRLDANGLAPDRHTESRRGRDVRAVNFQRDTARVTFSGPGNALALQAGAQDRLSWLLQLSAIVEANPALRATGSEIRVFVIGTRGDAETWRYTVLGREDLSLPIGAVVGALHLQREPQRLYDTHADVWLDPARQHLPVRVLLNLRATGAVSEWLLESAAQP